MRNEEEEHREGLRENGGKRSKWQSEDPNNNN